MKKTIKLILQNNKSMIKNNKIVFIIFILVQIITIISYIFFFSTIVKAKNDYISNDKDIRSIKISFSEITRGKIDYNLIESLDKNNILEIENMYFTFSALYNNTILLSYYKPITQANIIGSAISDNNIKNEENVIVTHIGSNNKKDKVGDRILINNINFTIIGQRAAYTDIFGEIPITTALNNFNIRDFTIIISPNIANNKKNEFYSLLLSKFPSAKIKMPKSSIQKTIEKLFLILLSSIFMGIISIFNFLFLYKFMIEKMIHRYIILYLCGCSRIRIITLISNQPLLIFSLCYIISLIMLEGFKALKIVYIFNIMSITLTSTLIIYFSFLILIIIILLPYIINLFNKTIITNQKNLNKG